MEPKIKSHKPKAIGGQSLIEILIAITLAVSMVVGAVMLFSASFFVSAVSRKNQASAALVQEILVKAKAAADADWNSIYSVTKTPPAENNKYHFSGMSITAGAESIISSGIEYNRYFYVENVNRENCGIGKMTSSAITASCPANFRNAGAGDIGEDKLTQKITAVAEWEGGAQKNIQSIYVSRLKNTTFSQFDWSGGDGQDAFPGGKNINNKFSSQSGIDFSSGIALANVSIQGELYSSTYDFGSAVALNSLRWNGFFAGNDKVNFQIATSNCPNGKTNPPACNDGGIWRYLGPDGLDTSYYSDTPGAPIKINFANHVNSRYFRYKVSIFPSASSVSDITVNWSR